MERLRRRAEFLAVGAGRKAPTAGFVVQMRSRGDDGPPRVGFTVSKKVGTAVERNRVRRRLKEAMRRSASPHLRRGHDYVIVGRRPALGVEFARLTADLEQALVRVAKRRDPGARRIMRTAEDRS